MPKSAFIAQRQVQKAYNKIISLSENVATLKKDTESLRRDQESLQKDKEEAEKELTGVNENKKLADQQLQEVSKRSVQAQEELKVLHIEKAALLEQNDKLLKQAGELRRATEVAVENLKHQLNQYQELARLTLLDSRARSQPLLSRREAAILTGAFGSLKNVENLLSDKSVQVQRSQVSLLGSKADVILAILRNQLPSALAKCDVALQSLDEQTDQSQTRGEFLQLRGDILTQQALLVWDTDGAPTQPNAPNIKADTKQVQQPQE